MQISDKRSQTKHIEWKNIRLLSVNYFYLKGLESIYYRIIIIIIFKTLHFCSHFLTDYTEEKKGKFVFTDTDTGILPGITRKCNMRSKFRCLTEFSNSHYVSQFAAFFIDVRA